MIKYEEQNSVARIVLARAKTANALSGEMLRQLAAAICKAQNSAARVVCIAGEGENFCAGADVQWMQQSAAASLAENKREAKVLADLLLALHNLPQPTIAVVRGACFGGGGGLAAAADICIAADNAKFCFSEVRLGLIPATIAPYVVLAIGERQARRLFLEGAVFNAATAAEIGLASMVVADSELENAVAKIVNNLMSGGKTAQQLIKELLAAVRNQTPGETLAATTAARLAECRANDEAKEGVAAFLQKRPPKWKSE